MSEPFVTAIGAGYSVNQATLVRDVDLEVIPGEVLGVLGPNGAGKSTLLRLLAADLKPTAGGILHRTISAADVSAGDLARFRSVYGLDTPSDIPFAVRSIVEMGRYPYRREPDNTDETDRAAVEDAMERTSTVDLGHRVFATLSSGERARVLLARMLAQDTDVVLMDEPTSNLDVRNAEHILTEGVRLSRAGRAVVSVFHDINEAARYADRLALMSHGRVVAEGEPDRVLTSGLLTQVYGQHLRVVDHPFLDCRLVLVGE